MFVKNGTVYCSNCNTAQPRIPTARCGACGKLLDAPVALFARVRQKEVNHAESDGNSFFIIARARGTNE